jgi:hypothetical protein
VDEAPLDLGIPCFGFESITANCGDWRYPRHCGGVEIDAPALMAKHGDLEIARLAGKLRCTTCGHRPEEVRPDWQLPERTARRLLL